MKGMSFEPREPNFLAGYPEIFAGISRVMGRPGSISNLFVGSWHRNHCFWQMTIGCSIQCCLSQPSNGPDNAPTCYRAPEMARPGISTKNAEKYPPPPRPKLWNPDKTPPKFPPPSPTTKKPQNGPITSFEAKKWL